MKISLKSNFGLLLGILALFSGLPSDSASAADVCSQGVGIPPFLSAGADPNLLLVLDNSGSMLDLAYIDDDSQCFDESYVSTNVPEATGYAGTYEMESWYKWTGNPGSVAQWTTAQCYTDGSIVYGEGAFYAATCQAYDCENNGQDGCRETRTYLSEPLANATILWDSPTAPQWSNSQDYASGQFVTYNKQVYKNVSAVNHVTYTTPPPQDTSFTHWKLVDYTWDGNTGYSVGSIVSYKGMLFKATAAVAAGRASASLFDDRTSGAFPWVRMDEGYFELIADIAADSCANPSYALPDMQITLQKSGVQISGSSPPAADQVTCFRAKGNFLNWASASKFDIQKKILTGGKYSAGYEAQKTVDGKKVADNSVTTDTGDDRLIQESRGCAGKSFAKQISLHAGVDEAMNTADDVKLTLRIRGSSENDQIDTTDDRTRIEIFAATVGGYDDSACQTAYTLLQQEQPNKTDLENAVLECIYGENPPIAQQVESLHDKSVMDCWKINKGDAPSFSGAFKTHCESIYDGTNAQLPQQYPWAITEWDPFYICYGEYDKTMATKGEGFIGRCWAELPSSSCSVVTCTNDTSAPITTLNADATGDDKYRCSQGEAYKCTKKVCQDKDYFKYYEDLSGDECATSSGSGVRVCEDINNDSVADPLPCWTQWEKVGSGPEAKQVTPAAWNTTGGGTDACIEYAEYDYCQGLGLPEVIDPSDQVFATGDTYNIPAALIDTGMFTQLNVKKPMLSMSGYLKYTLPDSQNSAGSKPQDPVERPDGPRGVLYDVAANLRMGVMAMNDNGALWECQNIAPDDDTVVRICPDTGNKDGARVITQIDEGMYTDDNGTPLVKTDDKENWDHYTKLMTSINGVRANAWTPLAEAVYSALSYYGQNKIPRLDNSDFKLPGEDSTEDPWPDPVKFWCQDNHILVITEGASTKDINDDVKTFAESHDDGDGAVESMCTDGLHGSTYLDNITWFGQKATVKGDSANISDLYSTLLPTNDPEFPFAKRPITTHVVTTGSPRTAGEGECRPETLMTNAAKNGGTELYSGENPAALETNLKRAFSEILGRASAGSAASVISSSRSGEGGVYQAIFWPQIDRLIGEKPLTWVGDVHAFFIDEDGLLWDDFSGGTDATYNVKGQLRSEDINGNGILDPTEDTNGNDKLDGDRRITTYFNNKTNSTHICFRFNTATGQCLQSDYLNTTVISFEIRDFDGYLWSVKEQLHSVPDVTLNRPLTAFNTWDFSSNKRYIFTWNDLDNDGIVDYADDDENEVIGLTADELEAAAGEVVSSVAQPRSGLLNDFNMASQDKLERFIPWYRGNDSPIETFDAVNGDKKFTPFDATEDENMNGVQDWVYRCRRYPSCVPTANALDNPVWRLGDVIHSTPTLVARPAEGFHFIYRDPEYSDFYKKYVNRRHVVYFGANDGMLHAVNAGFFMAGAKKFVPCREDQRDSNDITKCAGVPYTNGYPALGDELWAYVPYNLQKHLSCLAAPEYTSHKYFVDGPPRVFDVRIFAEDDDHPHGWGTILVGYMRFGGAPIAGNDDPDQDNREFVSSYFILDITNPEKPPKLLAEMTMTDDPQVDGSGNEIAGTYKYVDLGFTTSMPADMAMKSDAGGSEWFLILGNGPTELTGENTGMTFSNQKGRVAVVPLNSLTGVTWATGSQGSTSQVPFRIPNIELSTAPDGTQFGIFNLPTYMVGADAKNESFISDIVSVDFDITSKAILGVGVPYKTDVAYFGTTDGLTFVNDANGLKQWNGGGRMFRLLARQLDNDTGKQLYTLPYQWELAPLIDAKAPITGAANVGTSGGGIFWVYFGTGRFYSPDDKTDYSQQYFFGIKEPINQSTCAFTWHEVNWWPDTGLRTPNPGETPGLQGLLRTDPIHVIERGSFNINDEDSLVFCEDEDGNDCTLPLDPLVSAGSTYYSFASLEKYIVGERCGATADSANGIDGWYRKLTDPRERSLSMPTLLGGLATFTTYQPSDDLCTAEGSSFLYAAYSRTGTAWNEDIIGYYISGGQKIVRVRLDLGKGLALTPSLQSGTGDSAATAYIQTSTGDIVKIEQKELPFNTYKSGRQSWLGR